MAKFTFLKSFLCAALLFTVQLSAFDDTAVEEKTEEKQEKKEKKGPKLTIGSKAPSIDIEHWIHDGGGKFKEIKDFEDGKVYVVEFWATWCGPCIGMMPHLAELQKEYQDKGVQVISISDEKLEKVTEFLKKKVSKDEDLTYDELTSVYCLTADPDGSAYKDYFIASGEQGIPTSFVVGKTGVIEWIGHPGEIDGPLKKIVEDNWDRDSFAVKRIEKVKQQKEIMAIMRLARSGNTVEAIEKIDAVLEKSPENMQFLHIKLQLLMASGKHEEAAKQIDAALEKSPKNMPLLQMKLQILMTAGKHKEAAKHYLAIAENFSDDADTLNQLAWGIGRVPKKGIVPEEMLDAAVTIANMGIKLDPKDGAVLDTLAHLQYLKGDVDAAIATQTKAIELVAEDPKALAELKGYLEQLTKLKEEEGGADEDNEDASAEKTEE